MGKRFHVRYGDSFLEKEAEFTTKQKTGILKRARDEVSDWSDMGDTYVFRIQFPLYGYLFRLDFNGRDEWLLHVVGVPRRGERVDGHPITAARRKREEQEARDEKRAKRRENADGPNAMDKRIGFAHSQMLYDMATSCFGQIQALFDRILVLIEEASVLVGQHWRQFQAEASQWRHAPQDFVLSSLSQHFVEHCNTIVPRNDVRVLATQFVQIGPMWLRAPALRIVAAKSAIELWDKALFGERVVEGEMLS